MKRKIETVVRTVVLLIALANQVLVMAGKSPLPFDSKEVTELISLAATICASAWAWWKNNSLTAEAQQADEYLDALKSKKEC